MKEKFNVLAPGVEYYPESKTLLLVRCPECNKENWAPNVALGVCTWCGYDAHKLLTDKEGGQ